MIGSGLASRPDDPLLVLVDVADLGSASGSGPALLRNRRRYRFLRQAGHGASVLRLFCGLGHDGTIHALPKAGAIASHVRVPRDPALPWLLDPFGLSPNSYPVHRAGRTPVATMDLPGMLPPSGTQPAATVRPNNHLAMMSSGPPGLMVIHDEAPPRPPQRQ